MKTIQTLKQATMRVAALMAAIAAPSAFAASQTWSNAPTTVNWNTNANWIANAVPGSIILGSNLVNGDIATFNSPIPGSLIGGASAPVLIDNAVLPNVRSRQLGGFRFSTADVGAYEFSSLSAPVFAATGVPGTGILYLSHLGSVIIDSAVTNSQRFLLPVGIRLPSSTDGRYFISNNAAISDAALYFSSITNHSASSRQLILVLGGSNTGTNTVAAIGENVSGALRVVKNGSGRWILSGANQWSQQTDGIPASMLLEQGTLVVKDSAAFGSLTTGNISVSNGVLQVDGVTLNGLGLTLRNGGTIRMNGSGALNGLTVANQAGNSSTLATTSASDVFTVGSVGLNNGGLADSTLTTAGPGTIVYGIGSSYIGKHVFGGATNVIQIPTALGTGPNLQISAGAIADITPQGAATYTLDTSSLTANGTGTAVGSSAATIIADPAGIFDIGSKPVSLSFAPTSFTGDTTHPALYIAQGTFSLGACAFTIDNTSGTALGAGTYRLIEQATGNITASGTSFAVVTGAGLVAGHVAEIVVSGGNLNLVVVPHVAANLKWFGGNPDSNWDKTTANWTNGATLVNFGTGDNVLLDSVGAANPSVNVTGTVLPAAATVDTTANDYTISGVGSVAGSTSLIKVGTGNLMLSTVNGYVGGTVVSNGTLRLGVSEAIPNIGSGNVAVYSPATIDLNGNNNAVNALIGNGTVDNASGGASVLTIGLNGSSSTFTGLLANASGTLGLTKAGNGTLTLPGAHTYSGPTIINSGTLQVQNANSLGSGLSPVAINVGALRTTTSLNVNSLTGAEGTTVANAAGAGATIITHTGAGNYTGIISDGAAGTVGVYIPSGTLQLNNNNNYSGGTVIASGANLAIGVRNPGGSGNPGAAGITASNTAIISLPTSLSTASGVGNNITNVDANGTVYFQSAGQANAFNGQFIGAANNTNILSGPMSLGGGLSFANFPGTVIVSNGASVRFFTGTGVDAGGDNTTFIVEGFLFHRDVRTARLGALMGSNGNLSGPSNPGNPTATFIIGAKGVTTTFSGSVSGSNNIVKVGAANLTFDGVTYSTNVVTLPDPFEPTNIVSYALSANRVTYTGNTVVSNGTLKIVAPNNLTNSSSITLAGGTLDASMIGYSTNQTTLDYNSVEQITNTVVVTSGIVEILAGKSLNGQGSLLGSVTTDAASTITVGNPVGTMAISGSIAINGTVNMGLNRTNSPNNSDRITAASFSGAGATLNVADVGPALFSGTVFQLFNTGVTAFSTFNLPAASASGIPYTWQNNIATLGSITLVTGLNPNPTNVTATVTGGGTTLTLDWPSSHLGWTLQSQTNAINVGITGTWSNVAGSAATNQVVVPINPGNPTVFYRLTLAL